METNPGVSKNKTPKQWHPQHEKILKAWGESSACYRYLHYKSHQKYRKSSMRFTLPIIIISTITGTANFAQDTFPEQWHGYVPAGIGTLNLFAAILTTVAQFLKVNELQESHRVSSVHYGKLSRIIRLELSLPISERSHDGSNMVEICRSEFDRLIEQSPPIPGDILRHFEYKFASHEVTMPEISTVKPIVMYDSTHEIHITKKAAQKFLYTIKPEKTAKENLITELSSLKHKGLVSGRKKDDFFDCELAIGDDEVNSIDLDEDDDKHDENQ
jgi:hypothetical protein